MSDVEFGTWKDDLLGIKELYYIRIKTEFWFIGKNVAKFLDFASTDLAIRNHIFYDYKMTLEKFYGLYPSFVEKFKTDYFNRFHIWPKKSQILTNEPGVYQLATKSTSKVVEPFQRWIYSTIKKIRETGYYCHPSIENLSLEERKETIKFSIKNDIPDFVFGGANLKRNEHRDIHKEGKEKGKDLQRSIWGKLGGDKSSYNSMRARGLILDLSREDKDYLSELTRIELFEYIVDLVDKSKEIVKDFNP